MNFTRMHGRGEKDRKRGGKGEGPRRQLLKGRSEGTRGRIKLKK